jgi:hypothetical protein
MRKEMANDPRAHLWIYIRISSTQPIEGYLAASGHFKIGGGQMKP